MPNEYLPAWRAESVALIIAGMEPSEQAKLMTMLKDGGILTDATHMVIRTEDLRLFGEHVVKLVKKVRKHRRPTRNAERDAEIMRLHRQGMTAGEIA